MALVRQMLPWMGGVGGYHLICHFTAHKMAHGVPHFLK